MRSSPIIGLALLIGAGVLWVASDSDKETRHEAGDNGTPVQSGVALAPAKARDDFPAVPAVKASGRTVRMLVTAYCCCRICCEKWSGGGKTSIGDNADVCDGVAADPKVLPYRTKLDIPGVGNREVDDTGGAMRQDAKKGITHIDVRMATHAEARRFGRKWLDVKVSGN